MEYCYYVSVGVLGCYLDMLGKIQKQGYGDTGPAFADSLALQKIIEMWSVLVSFIATLLEDAHLSHLNEISATSLLLYLFPFQVKL